MPFRPSALALPLVLLAIPAGAATHTCRAVALLSCAPDACDAHEVPSTDYDTDANRIVFDHEGWKISICWAGRCWTEEGSMVFDGDRAMMMSGQMTAQFFDPEVVNFTAAIAGGRFTLTAAAPDSDATVITGDCQ